MERRRLCALDARSLADAAHVHDIGGIMGGEDSGVSDGTKDVLIECAYFTPEAIARTGQKLNLTSDAPSALSIDAVGGLAS